MAKKDKGDIEGCSLHDLYNILEECLTELKKIVAK